MGVAATLPELSEWTLTVDNHKLMQSILIFTENIIGMQYHCKLNVKESF